MPVASNGGVRLHWDERGTGTPVLLIQGHAASSAMWYPVVPALATRHRVIWFDNRGTGGSDVGRGTAGQDFVDDALAVLDAAGAETAHVVGVSMGGGIALGLGLHAPERVRSLVLGCTALQDGGVRPLRLRDRVACFLPRRLLRPWMSVGGYGPACSLEAAQRDIDVFLRSRYSSRGLLAQLKAIQSYDVTADKASCLRTPCLVQHGTADLTVPVERGRYLAGVLPNASLRLYEGAGHGYFVACPDAVDDVVDFLGDVDGGS